MRPDELASPRGAWRTGRSHGDAGAFHQSDPQPIRSATFHTVDVPTLVLGSTQPDTSVDLDAARSLNAEVVRRRSGGGGVLLMPGEFVWLDLVVPSGDPLWRDDVADAMVWVGELWQEALGSLGAADGSAVHHGRLVPSEWSQVVCFAGAGAGEVMRGDSKLVGISQRRTRSWARMQSMCHLRWRPDIAAALVAGEKRPTVAELQDVAACVVADASSIESALLDALARR
jgi:lipoate-protein ligase A